MADDETGPLPLRNHPYHWPAQDVLLLRSQKQTAWNDLLPWWCSARFPQVAIYWCHCRDYWVFESLRVRFILLSCCIQTLLTAACGCFMLCRDFFPVILTFLRQLPFIGSLLSLPYIRTVRTHFPHFGVAASILSLQYFRSRTA